MKLRTIAILSFSLLSSTTFANSVTLTDPDEEISGNSKVCIYEGHGITETVTVRKSANCPYAKTFQTDEEDE